MKQFLLLTTALLLAGSLLAQQDDDRLMPVEGDMGLTFDVSGLISNFALSPLSDPSGNNALLFRYYYKDNSAFRLGFGLQTQNNRTTAVDSVGNALVEYDSTFNKVDFYISPGIEKHFTGSRRLDPYLAASLDIGLLGKTTTATNTATTDTIGVSSVKVDGEYAGGNSIGLSFAGGFNYFFSKRLSLGAEYSFGLATSRQGGDFARVTTTSPVSGAGTTSRETGSNLQRSTGIRLGTFAGVTLSWFFARNPKS